MLELKSSDDFLGAGKFTFNMGHSHMGHLHRNCIGHSHMSHTHNAGSKWPQLHHQEKLSIELCVYPHNMAAFFPRRSETKAFLE